MRPPSASQSVPFERPVYGTFDNRQVFFRAKLQLVADPLPLFAFFSHNLRVKIPFHGKSADLNQLDHHRQARNRTLILNVGKIPPFNPTILPMFFVPDALPLVQL